MIPLLQSLAAASWDTLLKPPDSHLFPFHAVPDNQNASAMDRGRRAMPTLNKHTDGASYERSMAIHKKKLNGIKSSIDTTAPPPRMHLRKNLKKEQMMEENYAKIERENRILLSKMSNIMQTNTLDNQNQSAKYAHSLNKEARRRELERITMENQAILGRIQMREPTYDHLQWEHEAKQNQKYGENVREFKDPKPGTMMKRSG